MVKKCPRVSMRVKEKEGLALLLKELREYVKKFKEVSARLMWVRMKVDYNKVHDFHCIYTW